MNPEIYKDIVLQEDGHWWFVARRAIFAGVFSRLKLPVGATILDAGCGGGGNLPLLAQFGNVHAFEMHEASCSYAKGRNIGDIRIGKLPDEIPFDNQTFDLITLFDVLEHVEDDKATLAALMKRIKPGGLLFLNVPAYQFLFGKVDVLHHHYRRYSKGELRAKLQEAGFTIELMTYWNFFLFPVALAVRLFEQVYPSKGLAVGMKTPKGYINRALASLVSFERFLMPYARLPFGLSLLLVARKPF